MAQRRQQHYARALSRHHFVAAGYEFQPDTSAIGARLPGYVALDEQDPLAAGIVTREGQRVAILRIERFAPQAPECAAALTELQISQSDACDDSCAARVRARIDDLFVAGMERRLRALESRQPDLLLVDLATNGGGDDSSIALARMLSADAPSPAIGHMRGERLAKYLTELRESLETAAKRAARADRPLFERAVIAHSDDSELISSTSRYSFTAGNLVAAPLQSWSIPTRHPPPS